MSRVSGPDAHHYGWFVAKFRTLLRNMLVREEANNLHLLSVISPYWVREEERISV
ncbi:MAG: hypothetical protein ACE5GI_03130 [Candidatus Aminicenantales bacterium]